MDEVTGFRSFRASRSTVGLTGSAVLVASIVVATWVSAGRSDRTPQPSVVEPSIDLAGVTPWTASPVKGYQAPPPTSTPQVLSDEGPPCTADDVVATIDGGDGMGGHAATYVGFRNTSTTSCVLKGYPEVVATEPGRPDVRGTNGSWFQSSSGTATMRPGESTALVLETDTYCDARPGGGGGIPPYHHVAFTLPAGGTVQLGGPNHPFDITCGLFLTRFYVEQPRPAAPRDPLRDLSVSIEAPSTAVAGESLIYVVTLTNPTDQPIALDRCPSYTETLLTTIKAAFQLNCAPVKAIAPHAAARFEMRLSIPDSAEPRHDQLIWQLAGPKLPGARQDLTLVAAAT